MAGKWKVSDSFFSLSLLRINCRSAVHSDAFSRIPLCIYILITEFRPWDTESLNMRCWQTDTKFSFFLILTRKKNHQSAVHSDAFSRIPSSLFILINGIQASRHWESEHAIGQTDTKFFFFLILMKKINNQRSFSRFEDDNREHHKYIYSKL